MNGKFRSLGSRAAFRAWALATGIAVVSTAITLLPLHSVADTPHVSGSSWMESVEDADGAELQSGTMTEETDVTRLVKHAGVVMVVLS